MGRVAGLLIGGVLGAIAGYMMYPDLAVLTAIAGAAIGVKTGNRGRKVTYDNDGEWYNGQEGDSFDDDSGDDDGGGDD
jgi:hypothetical protein